MPSIFFSNSMCILNQSYLTAALLNIELRISKSLRLIVLELYSIIFLWIAFIKITLPLFVHFSCVIRCAKPRGRRVSFCEKLNFITESVKYRRICLRYPSAASFNCVPWLKQWRWTMSLSVMTLMALFLRSN